MPEFQETSNDQNSFYVFCSLLTSGAPLHESVCQPSTNTRCGLWKVKEECLRSAGRAQLIYNDDSLRGRACSVVTLIKINAFVV